MSIYTSFKNVDSVGHFGRQVFQVVRGVLRNPIAAIDGLHKIRFQHLLCKLFRRLAVGFDGSCNIRLADLKVMFSGRRKSRRAKQF